jgi:hypothetical protein
MSTYGDMKTRIADELARSDLTTQIAQQIQSAIAQYQRKLFFFNEKTNASWDTIANQELYTTTDGVPSDIVSIDKLTVIYSTVREDVRRRDWDYIEDLQPGTSKGGQPTDYAYREQKFRLYPIPTTVMTLNLAYVQRIAAPTGNEDTGVWMNEAEELIRSSAKRRLFQHVIQDEGDLSLARAAEEEALADLMSETSRRLGTGYIKPTQF